MDTIARPLRLDRSASFAFDSSRATQRTGSVAAKNLFRGTGHVFVSSFRARTDPRRLAGVVLCRAADHRRIFAFNQIADRSKEAGRSKIGDGSRLKQTSNIQRSI